MAKYSILLSIKESYLFTRNSLGLIFHPYKTIRSLIRERDYSQILLLISLPAYVLAGGLGVIWFGRRLIHAPYGVWGFYTKVGVLGTFTFSFAIFCYLGFWVWQVWKIKNK
ncbi:hypothetical protein COX08_04810 [Candidatus Beckwithbacteria bacterium CG23_combo_of_CG06-09_8_20_14_all_34_8]|uniref:Yip1 domain-containing protein n=1 Tax=Candidatus Beckwithbacteria bacterium CG23_combo_of_CG06-09_8_20_14_all_34_8 TaxID=1974497 RepID=A0A2H0B502_9BACT|nr:MAG: hypothetical protein COX08_04810 [Candidatus Beckwithbacteria bacterium CG23_combo_of_CG06-09_8_20_14_all_34_8]